MLENFFQSRRDWSRYKHDILQKYLQIWVYKLAKNHPELVFLDGCAGEGYYADGTQGSPLIAVKWNDEQVLRKYGHRLIVHACEPDEVAFASLQLVMESYIVRKPPRAILYRERFQDALPRIMSAIGTSPPLLVFIDPFAYQELEPEYLRPLLDHPRDRTEILFRADPTLLARWAGWLKEAPRSTSAQRAAPRFRAKLARLMIDPTVIEEAMKSRPVGWTPDGLLLLETYLQAFEARFRYVQWIPIRPSYYAAIKYYLIHCTNSPHGAAKINDAVSTTEDSMYIAAEEAERGAQMAMFVTDRAPPRVTPSEGKRTIVSYLEGGRRPFIEVAAHLSMQHGPDFRERDHKRMVRELADAGKLKIEGPERLDPNCWLSLVR